MQLFLTVRFDIRPLSFCDGHIGMKNFAQTFIKIKQILHQSERSGIKSYLPDRNAVESTVKELSNVLCQNFLSKNKMAC